MKIKLTSNNDFDFDCPSVALLKDGITLTKTAAIRDKLKYEKTPNQEDLHVIAVGAYEGTGANRNLDIFTEDDCIKNHKYFRLADRAVNRHHKNKKTDPKYGNIKAAAYNSEMKRIELVLGLDKDKASDILHEQEKTGNTNWSMACKIPYDICTFCGKKAPTDKDRCEHIPAKLGELSEDGKMCAMLNVDPRWFEISYVKRPADRIGMSLGKCASVQAKHNYMSQQDIFNTYAGFDVPEEITLSKKAADKRVLLDKLAALEKRINGLGLKTSLSKEDTKLKDKAERLCSSDCISAETMDELRKYEPGKLLRVLSENGITFSPEDFAHYILDDNVKPENVKGMKSLLPDIFSNFDDSSLHDEKYEPSFGSLPSFVKKIISSMIPDFSLKEEPTVGRVIRITIMGKPKKEIKHADDYEKSKEAFDKLLANQYVAYKLAALNYMNDIDVLDDDMLLNAVIQNRC